MDSTTTFTQFMDQPVSELDPKKLLELAKKNLKIFGEIEQKQFKRIEAQLKYEEKLEKKEKETRDVQTRRQKELDNLKEKNYKEELDRTKKQKDNFDRIKDSFDPEIFNRISSSLNLLPDKTQNISGEQKNIGEDIMRVSFNKEGIQILKTLLDPIYKALQANTENLDKLLKKITDGERSGGGGGIGWWLTAIAGTLLVLWEQIYERIQRFKTAWGILTERWGAFVEYIKGIPERLKKWLKLDEIVDWVKMKWAKMIDALKDLQSSLGTKWDSVIDGMKTRWASFVEGTKSVINFDELADAFNTRWTRFMNSLKEAKAGLFNFDDLTNAFKVKWVEWLNDIKSVLNFDELTKGLNAAKESMSNAWSGITGAFENFSKGISSWWDNLKGIWTGITESFQEGGFMWKIMDGIKGTFDSVKTVFSDFLIAIEPLLTPLKQFGQWVKPFFRFFDILFMVVDPVVAAVKTLSEVWDNDKLSGLEKSIATLVAAFFGLADGVFALVGYLSQGITGVWNWMMGRGWDTDNALNDTINNMTQDKEIGGFGDATGRTSADIMEKGTESTTLDWLKGLLGIDVGAKALATPYSKKVQEFQEDNVITPEEQKILDTKFDEKGQPVDDFIMQPKGVSNYIMDKSTGSLYQTNPNDEIIATKKGGIIDKSLEELKAIMSAVNQGIQNLNNNMGNAQPTIISNNTTTTTNSNNDKKYLFKPLYDINTDKRSLWWRESRGYYTGV